MHTVRKKMEVIKVNEILKMKYVFYERKNSLDLQKIKYHRKKICEIGDVVIEIGQNEPKRKKTGKQNIT